MNITTAIVFVNGTATTKIESECLVECAIDDTTAGALIDRHRQLLEQTFSEIHGNHVEVLFPEIGEVLE